MERFFVTDGEEYIDPVDIPIPGGRLALFSTQNEPEREYHQDAVGFVINGTKTGISVTDGVASSEAAQEVASMQVKHSLAHFEENEGRVSPLAMTLHAAGQIAIDYEEEKGERKLGLTVGASLIFDENGGIAIHHYGDPEFAHYQVGEQRLIAPPLKLLPHNATRVAFESVLRQLGITDLTQVSRKLIEAVLMPRTRWGRKVTNYVANVAYRTRIDAIETTLRLAPGDWFMAFSDGGLLYRYTATYQKLIEKGITPSEFAEKVLFIAETYGGDNATGVIIQRSCQTKSP